MPFLLEDTSTGDVSGMVSRFPPLKPQFLSAQNITYYVVTTIFQLPYASHACGVRYVPREMVQAATEVGREPCYDAVVFDSRQAASRSHVTVHESSFLRTPT